MFDEGGISSCRDALMAPPLQRDPAAAQTLQVQALSYLEVAM